MIIVVFDLSSPANCPALSPKVTQVDGGSGFTVALREDGTVWTYGYNAYGRLGDGTGANSNSPIRLAAFSDALSVAAGECHALAVKADGTVWAWGCNGYGQLGDGTTETRLWPVQVKDPADPSGYLANVIAVAASSVHSLALKADGTVRAWGYNGNGQLGDNTYLGKTTPVQVRDPLDPSGFLKGITAMAAGHAGNGHSVALKGNGTVWTWGTNDYGVLGRTPTAPVPQSVAGQVPGLTAVKAVASGWEHVVALTEGGLVYAWGRNLEGQLGDSTAGGSKASPNLVPGLSGVSAIGAAQRFSLAAKGDGSGWGWGDNSGGQLCINSQTNSPGPVQMLAPADQTGFLTGVKKVAGGFWFSEVIREDGTVWGCGWSDSGQLGNASYSGSPKRLPVRALFPNAGLVYAWIPGLVTPGDETTILVGYKNNLSETLTDAVVIFNIPANFTYLSSTGSGIYRDDRSEVFWRPGTLNPGDSGEMSLKIQVPWGIPMHTTLQFLVDIAARNIDSGVDLDNYLTYSTVAVASDTALGAGEINTLLATDREIRDMLNYAVGLGYHSDNVADRLSLTDGTSATIFTLLDPATLGPVFVRKEAGAAFIEKYGGNTYSLLDTTGGFRQNWLEQSFSPWGDWAETHSDSRANCISNCITQNMAAWNLYIATEYEGNVKPCVLCRAALQAGQSDPVNCANCARLYLQRHTQRHLRYGDEIGKCINDCQANSNQWQCSEGQIFSVCRLEFPAYEAVKLLTPDTSFIPQLQDYRCLKTASGTFWYSNKYKDIHNCAYGCREEPVPHCADPCEVRAAPLNSSLNLSLNLSPSSLLSEAAAPT